MTQYKINSYSEALQAVQNLLKLKNSEFSEIFDIYDELNLIHKKTLLSWFFVFFCIGVPVFISSIQIKQTLAGCVFVVVLIHVYVYAANAYFKYFKHYDMHKKLEALQNTSTQQQFKHVCINKYSSVLPFFKLYIPELRIWLLIFSIELKTFLTLVQNTILDPLSNYLQTFSNKHEFLEYAQKAENLTEDDLHFLTTLLIQKHSLAKIFKIS